ncbi:MAG: hypothetical protein WCG85_19240 [Polyangia bacterium]
MASAKLKIHLHRFGVPAVLLVLVVGCKNGSDEKVDAGQRKYCASPDAGADRGVGDGSQVGDAADAGAGMDLAVEGPGPVDVPTPRVDGTIAGQGDAIGDGGDSGSSDLATGTGGTDGSGGTAGTGGTTGTGGAVGTGGRSTGGTGGVVGPDASPDLRPDAGSGANDAPFGDTAAATDLRSGETSSAADTGNELGDSGAPEARADVALPVPDASVDVTPADLPAGHPDGPSAVCNLSASNWAQAWNDPKEVSLTGLAIAGDGTLWATGYLSDAFDFGTGPILYTDPPADPNFPSSADAFLAKLDPTTGLATAAFDFGDSSHNDQQAVAVAVSQSGTVNVIGSYVGEIDFDPNAVNALFGGNATLGYYVTFAGASTGSTPTFIAAHAVDLGNGTLVANGSNPGVDAFVICGNADHAVPLWNSTTKNLQTGLLKPTAATYVDGLDIVVAMVNASDGTVIWGKQIGGTGDQTCESATIDNNGDVIIAGNYGGTLDFGGGPLPSAQAGDAYLYAAKLGGADGHYIAAGGWGSAGRSDAYGVTVDSSNNIVVAGAIAGNVNFGGGVSIVDTGLTDAFVAKFNSALVPQWAKSFGDGAKDQSANTVASDSLGNIYVAGTYEGSLGSFLGLSVPANSNPNAWSAQLASDGSTLQCAQSFGVPLGTDSVTSMVVARAATGALSDAVFIGGSFSSKITFGSKVLDTGKGSTFAPFVTRFAPP